MMTAMKEAPHSARVTNTVQSPTTPKETLTNLETRKVECPVVLSAGSNTSKRTRKQV
jgi:hypothetical protein